MRYPYQTDRWAAEFKQGPTKQATNALSSINMDTTRRAGSTAAAGTSLALSFLANLTTVSPQMELSPITRFGPLMLAHIGEVS